MAWFMHLFHRTIIFASGGGYMPTKKKAPKIKVKSPAEGLKYPKSKRILTAEGWRRRFQGKE